MTMFKLGDKVRFTQRQKENIKVSRATARRKADRVIPSWLDKAGTVVRVEAEGWMIVFTMDGEEGEMGVNKNCLEHA